MMAPESSKTVHGASSGALPEGMIASAPWRALNGPAKGASFGCSDARCGATVVVVIRRAKYNFKYKRRKGNKPRLNADDLGAIEHLLKGTRVTHTYDPTTNDLCFDTHVEGGRSLVIDGEDTGGQVIRAAMALAIKISGGRAAPLGVLQIRSSEKACMLYVQAAMHTLEPGDSFTVRGGNPINADAPSFHDFQRVFIALNEILGWSYELLDLSDGDCSQFMLTRHDDSIPSAKWDQGGGNLSIYMLDQILMALVFVSPGVRVTLCGDYDRDYHVSAMVKMARLVGHSVDDAVDGARRVIKLG